MGLTRRLTPYLLAVPFLLLGCNKKESPTEPIINHAPKIQGITSNPSEAFPNEEVNLECRATDEDNDELSYDWRCDDGYFSSIDQRRTIWNAPEKVGEYHITVKVDDREKSASENKTLEVISRFDTVYVAEDGYVDSRRPDFISQMNENDVLHLHHGSEGDNVISYLRFELGDMRGNIKSARLLLDVIGGSNEIENPNAYLHETTQSWRENSLNYNNQPEINPTPEYHFNLPWDNWNTDTISFDITSLAEKWIISPSDNKGFCLKPSSQMIGGYSFTSKEATNWPWAKPPRIIIEKEH